MEMKICNFLSTLYLNEDFISQESPILADVENIVFDWIRIVHFLYKIKPHANHVSRPLTDDRLVM